jgi:membrane fusion protein, heavy metal efflux system
MKKILVGAVAALGIGAVVFAGVAYLRPDLLSKLGMPLAKSGEADYGLFCKEHGVPEKFCTLCHPELKEKLLLCPEHGSIPEDICTKCHPENAAKYDITPCEHGLPAHFCPKCHPENFKEGGTASAGPNLINDGWCAEFGEKGPDGKVKYCTFLPMVRLASGELPGDIGLKTASVIEEEYARELTANAETAYDANRYAEIVPRVRGYVREARVDLGKAVKAGETLAVVDSSEVSTGKTQYLSADAAFKLANDTNRRVHSLLASNAIAVKEEIATRTAFNQAKASVLDAEQRLRNFRFDTAALEDVLKTGDTRPILEIPSPIDGTVILRHAVLGEAVEPTANLFTVADTSKLWLWIDVYERDIAQVREGQTVAFSVSGVSSSNEGAIHTGRITWVGAEVDEKTRTTKVRAEIPNPGGTLRAHQYGKARIRIEEPHKALTVAKAAIQRYENTDLVFLTEKGSSYRPQRIKSRPIDRRDSVEVTWGLKPGQEVVTDGSFLLKTEIMKGSIGAGCCD